MRRFSYYPYLLIGILVSLMFLSSCHKDRNNTPSKPSLIGRWEMKEHNSTTEAFVFTLCLYEDSTFTMSASGAVPQSGKWTVSQDSLKCSGNRNGYSGRTNDSYEFVFKIVRHNDKNLFLGDFDSKQVMELERIHE